MFLASQSWADQPNIATEPIELEGSSRHKKKRLTEIGENWMSLVISMAISMVIIPSCHVVARLGKADALERLRDRLGGAAREIGPLPSGKRWDGHPIYGPSI